MKEKSENIIVHGKLPEISGRMRAVLSMVSPGSTAADIGCDHGYVSIYLYNSGICRHCIAADVKEGPLRSAKKNIRAYRAETGVEARLSDGLKNIKPGEADCILISGMGGNLIIKILDEASEKCADAKELVLEPQSDADKVRKYLYANGYVITKEAFVKECGKYYPVIKAVHAENGSPLSAEEYIYGPCLLEEKNELLMEYLQKERKRIDSVLSSLADVCGEAADKRKSELKNELEITEKAIGRF